MELLTIFATFPAIARSVQFAKKVLLSTAGVKEMDGEPEYVERAVCSFRADTFRMQLSSSVDESPSQPTRLARNVKLVCA